MEKKSEPIYKRVLLKLSGEVLGRGGEVISAEVLDSLAIELAEAVKDCGIQLGVVTGAGNIVRGTTLSGQAGIGRITADYMGMIGTVINSLALQDALEKEGVKTVVMSAIPIGEITEPYSIRKAVEYLELGRVVIFACGTGSPYFTTDTAAALRAVETGADVLMKGTKVDGVYDKDPALHSDARKIEYATFDDVIEKELRVMDITAATLCKENSLPIVVFDVTCKGNFLRALKGENIGTFIGPKKEA